MGAGGRLNRRHFWGGAQRPRLLRYGLYRALLLVAILIIPSIVEPILREEAQRLILDRLAPRTYGAPGVPNTLPAQTLHQAAPPTASGAHPPYPLNHTFDAEPIDLGAQPNADFETTPATAGTPPTNHDLARRLTAIVAPGETIGYEYDNANRLETLSDPIGSTTYTYDDAGRVTQVGSPQGTVGYTYDAMGRRESMTVPGVGTTEYDYDGDQLVQVIDPQSQPIDFTYDAAGLLESITRPNGVSTEYDYEAAERLTAISHFDALGTPLVEYGYLARDC